MRDPYVIHDSRPNDVWPGLCVWWGPDRCGYTTDLDRAGRYTKDEAEAQHRHRPTDIPVPLWAARVASMTVVDVGALRIALGQERTKRRVALGGGDGPVTQREQEGER